MSRQRAVVYAVLFTALTALSAHAQDKSLKGVRSFRCTFTQSASAVLDRDVARLRTGADTLQLVFDQLDVEKGTGRMIGNIGATDVGVIGGSESIAILERVNIGIFQITVIYPSR